MFMKLISINKNRVAAFSKRIYRGEFIRGEKYFMVTSQYLQKKKHTADAATFIEIFSMAVFELQILISKH